MSRRLTLAERAFVLAAADAVAGTAAVLLSMWTWTLTASQPFDAAFAASHALWLLSIPLWVFTLAPTRHASVAMDARGVRRGIARAVAALLTAYLLVFFYAGRDAIPRLMALYVLWNSAGLTIAGRLVLMWIMTRDAMTHRVVIVGDRIAIASASALLEGVAFIDAEIVGTLAVEADAVEERSLDRVVTAARASEVVVAFADEVPSAVLDGLLRCQEAGIGVVGVEQLYEATLRRIPVRSLSRVWLLTHLFGAEGARESSPLAKRALDLAVALPLAAGAVLITPLVAGAILIDSGRPIFYRQTRVGRGGRLFQITKFRTMQRDAERHGPQWSPSGDSRITRVGRWLRRSHIDELPQLLSVFRGDMSLVGPRPERPEFVRLLEQQVPLYRGRVIALPGVTGWAQVNHGYGDSVDDAIDKLEYDLYYLRHRSLGFDIEILLNTIGRMLGWRGR